MRTASASVSHYGNFAYQGREILLGLAGLAAIAVLIVLVTVIVCLIGRIDPMAAQNRRASRVAQMPRSRTHTRAGRPRLVWVLTVDAVARRERRLSPGADVVNGQIFR